jgi:hypothetical protein
MSDSALVTSNSPKLSVILVLSWSHPHDYVEPWQLAWQGDLIALFIDAGANSIGYFGIAVLMLLMFAIELPPFLARVSSRNTDLSKGASYAIYDARICLTCSGSLGERTSLNTGPEDLAIVQEPGGMVKQNSVTDSHPRAHCC